LCDIENVAGFSLLYSFLMVTTALVKYWYQVSYYISVDRLPEGWSKPTLLNFLLVANLC
jgi:hypothetical protein